MQQQQQQQPWLSMNDSNDNDDNWMSSVVEQSIELLTMCECGLQGNNNNNNTDTRTRTSLESQSKQQQQQQRVVKRDYAKLHDEFLEALLYEQQQQQNTSDTDRDATSLTLSRDLSLISSCSTLDSTDASKKRPRRVTRRSRSQVANLDSLLNNNNNKKPTITTKTDPLLFLDRDCLLQKDKGVGDELGSSVCARGRSACYAKLQSKINMLCRPCSSTTRGISDVSRLQARVTKEARGYTETRCVFSFRVGFLSMQYGVLFQWMTGTGKIGLVVLRKMCSADFYKASSNHNTSGGASVASSLPEWLVSSMGGNHHALIQQADGTEVALLDAPYRVERPLHFEPSRLLVRVTHLDGIVPTNSSLWFLQMKLCDQAYRVPLVRHPQTHQWQCAPEGLAWEIPLLTDEACLEVQLLEQKQRRKKVRLAETVPLVWKVKTRVSEQRQYRVSRHVYKLTLSVLYQSDHAHWLFQELQARRTQEQECNYVSKAPLKTPNHVVVEDECGVADFCCVC